MAKSPAETKNYTPQQIDFALRYYTPNSATYGNAYASAKAAKYSETYARSITDVEVTWMQAIVSDIIGKPTDKNNLMAKAKKVLAKTLEGGDMKLAQDTAKFIAKTDPEFSEKLDMTTDGKSINAYNALTAEELRKLASK